MIVSVLMVLLLYALVKEIISKVENAVTMRITSDFPEYIVRKSRASELRSKFSV